MIKRDQNKVERTTNYSAKNDFFSTEQKKSKVIEQGIPVIKNNNVVAAKKVENDESKIFPTIPMDRKKDIFPDMSKKLETESFFDEEEFKDLNNYMEEKKKENWF